MTPASFNFQPTLKRLFDSWVVILILDEYFKYERGDIHLLSQKKNLQWALLIRVKRIRYLEMCCENWCLITWFVALSLICWKWSFIHIGCYRNIWDTYVYRLYHENFLAPLLHNTASYWFLPSKFGSIKWEIKGFP